MPTGVRTTANVAAEQRAIDMSDPILDLEPDSVPLTVITKKISKSSAKDVKIQWEESELGARYTQVNNGAGYVSGATSIVVDSGAVAAPKNVIVSVPRTGELMFVTGISTNTWTVTRGFAGSTAAALVDDDPLFVIGSAAEEYSMVPDPVSPNPVNVFNYLQIFRKSMGASGTWMSSDNLTKPLDWKWQSKQLAIEHAKDIEHALLFGRPSAGTGADGRPIWTTGGLNYFLANNRLAVGGALTQTNLDTWMLDVCRYGSVKTLFASGKVMAAINGFAVGKLQIEQGENTYGLRVQQYIGPHGTLNLIRHPLLEGAIYGGYAFAVDMKRRIEFKYLDGGDGPSRDTKLLTNRQEPGRDGQIDELLTQAGLLLGNPKAHGVLTGVTG
jgi:hypothetical protein